LSEQARAAGVTLSNVVAINGKSPSGAIYEEVKVRVQFKATFSQLLLFLSFITRTDKIIVLKDAKLNKSDENGITGAAVINFSGAFVGYRYKKASKTDKASK